MKAFLPVALFILWGLIACGEVEAPAATPIEKIEPTATAVVEALPTWTQVATDTPMPTETLAPTATRTPAATPTRRLARGELLATRASLESDRGGAEPTAPPVVVNTPIPQPVAPQLPTEQPEPTIAPAPVGAQPTEAPPPPVVEAPAGCINLNTASFEELQGIIHIGPERAQDVIAMRPWSSVNQLIAISGIGQTKLNDILNEGKACV